MNKKLMFTVLAVFHALISFVAITKSAAIVATPAVIAWRGVAEVLSFPFGQLANAIGFPDSIVMLMMLNAVSWAALGTWVAVRCSRAIVALVAGGRH